MKQKFTFLTMLCTVLILFSHAQNSSPYWSIAGNNNETGTSKLGTTNKVSLHFYTNNLQRMYMDSSNGNIGVGTTVPLTKLHVLGSGSFGNRVTTLNATRALNLCDTAAVMRILRVDYSNAPAVELISRKTADGANIGYWDMYVQPSDASFRIRDRTNGLNDRFTITEQGSVGIGTINPSATLDVEASEGTSIYAFNTGNFGGGQAILAENGNAEVGIGVHGTGFYGLEGDETSLNSNGVGVVGIANTTKGTGVTGKGYYGVYGTGGTYGLYGYSGTYGAYGYGGTYGMYGYGGSYGLYGNSYSGYGGYLTSTNSYALVVSGSSSAPYAGIFYGSVYSSTGFVTSDKNLKTNIHEFVDAMSIINKLKPQNYEFKKDAKYASLNLPKGSHYGLLAQDLEQVLPNLVSEAPHELRAARGAKDPLKLGADGKPVQAPASDAKIAPQKTETITIKAVNYVELIPIIIKAMQEMNATKDSAINDLQHQINQLKSMIISGGGSTTSSFPSLTTKSVTLSSAAILQNIPNPFTNNTTIQYSLPSGYSNASIVITDKAGKTLKTIALNGSYSGTLQVEASTLASGAYQYALIVDGNLIDTNQMLKVR